jgi:photosystem II stability/assembly factor-like uncharacterized protein
VTDPRDDLDAWLKAQVRPLPPPPGTFELIRKRARRRKLTRAVVTAAGAAAVIAIIAAVPTLLIPRLQLGPGPTQSGAQAGQTQDASPAHPSASPPTPSPTSAAALPPVPANFAATSVTFIGTLTGWVLGQAGVPGHCPIVAQDCTSIARTDDGGASWYGVHAPVTGAPDGPAGVSQIRFLDRNDGWAFGPELYATHDGGQTWARISTAGLRVTALEARGDRAFAVWAQCTGNGSYFAVYCTSFAVYSAAAGGNDWVPVAGATAAISPGSTTGSASLLLTGTRGYLLTPGGDLVSGPVSGQGAWQRLVAAPAGAACTPGAAQPNGQPAAEMLAATGPSGLVLVCPGLAAAGSQPNKTVYTSADGGTKWQLAGRPPAVGTVTSVAGTPAGAIVLATSVGIEVSTDGGATWTAAGGARPAGGFAFVGMTTSSQGVAVPADPSQHAVWFTRDGGQTWQASPIK